MDKYKQILKDLIKNRRRETVVAGVVVAFSLIGLVFMALSNAATTAIALEAESGTLSGSTAAGSAAGASGNASVKFGGGSVAGDVGLWDRFEETIPNTKSYSNPYKDVTLNVEYTKPDGSKVSFWGFYDGGSNWKIRFMPDKTGTWSYNATFSDGTAGKSGSFTVGSSTIPGMLSQDETNPMWFGYKGGGHGLVRSLHVGDRFFAANWPATDRKAFLDWAGNQGYNMLSVASFFLNRDAGGRGEGWETPDLWSDGLKEEEYDKLETMLNDLSDRRMMVYPFAGFFGKQSDYPTDEADQTLYIKYTLARLGPYWNIMFNVAGPEPGLDDYISESDINRLGAEIKANDPFGHLVAVHNPAPGDPYAGSAWSSYSIIQGPKTASQDELHNYLIDNHPDAKPLYAQESFWPGNVYNPGYSDTDIRKQTYVMNMSAATLNFADMDGDSSSGFSGSMDLNEKHQGWHDIVKKVWDFFETVPFYTMKPVDCDGGYCLGNAGQEYLGYLPSGGSMSISVTGGPYNVEWINAQDTSQKSAGGTTADGQGLTPPSGGDDWLVRLTK